MARRDLLRQPVAQAACGIALTHLDAARDAYARLKLGNDAEALHDFRVALRRTRSVLRAYRPWLEHIPRKQRRQLRTLARATNVARDTEVMMDWLRIEWRKIGHKHRPGFARLQALLKRRYEDSYSEITHEVLKEFAGLEQRLRASLIPAASTEGQAMSSLSYAVVTADLIREHLAELAEHLDKVRSVEDAEAIHAVRIRGKRLRYLIEPLAGALPSADRVVKQLKQFQDRFGVLCDAFVQAREISQSVETAGAGAARGDLERALRFQRLPRVNQKVLSGLIALALRLQLETRRRYAVVTQHYFGARTARFFESFEEIADTLSSHST